MSLIFNKLISMAKNKTKLYIDYFYSEPGRITSLGRLIFQIGSFLLIAGAIGRVATGTINILPTLARQAETSKTLADIYPSLPLWWVPETWFGAAAAGLLIVGGICLNIRGKQVDRLLKM